MTPRQIIISPPDPTFGTPDDTRNHVVLVHPEIPGNTGNIARLCAGTGAVLHLVKPLGFILEDRYLKRAGLDYWPNVTLCVHDTWDHVTRLFPEDRLWLFSTHTDRPFHQAPMPPGTALVFGRESVGLEPEITQPLPHRLVRIPMTPHVRSLNLSNAVSIGIFEAMRQQGYAPCT